VESDIAFVFQDWLNPPEGAGSGEKRRKNPFLSPFLYDRAEHAAGGFRVGDGIVVMERVADVSGDGVEFVIR